jgi:hippurate hydrolase
VAAQVGAEVASWVEIYEHLHANPELSYQEKETAAFLAGRLRELGFRVEEEVGNYHVDGRVSHGVVAVLENGPGPTVMVRTDLDGLPVAEKTGSPYASRAVGIGDGGDEVPVMHACGHDLHMTSFLGTAEMLSRMRDSWRGTLLMIGQPAEERGAGAKAMLDGGLFERFPRPDYALALHANATMPAGSIGMLAGYALANVDSVDILVRGRGGHGAYPHATKDPVTLAAQIITNLQTIVSRQISPFDPAVITVGSIHGGTKHNIIPDEVRLQLTVRSYRPEVRRHLLESIRQVATDTARGAGFPDELLPVIEVREEEFTPSTYNDPELVNRLTPVFRQAPSCRPCTRQSSWLCPSRPSGRGSPP